MIKYLLFENPYPIIIIFMLLILFFLKFSVFIEYRKKIIYTLIILIPILFLGARFIDTDKEIFNKNLDELVSILKKSNIKFKNKGYFFHKDIKILINDKKYEFKDIDNFSKNNDKIKFIIFNDKIIKIKNNKAILNANIRIIITNNSGIFRLDIKLKSNWVKIDKRFIIKNLNVIFKE